MKLLSKCGRTATLIRVSTTTAWQIWSLTSGHGKCAQGASWSTEETEQGLPADLLRRRLKPSVMPLYEEVFYMRTLEEMKSAIEALPRREYLDLVQWLSERNWQAWDEEIERDSASGKLDFLIQEALEEKSQGKLGSL